MSLQFLKLISGKWRAAYVSTSDPLPTTERGGSDVELGHVQLTSFSSAAGLGSIPTGARWALIEVEGAPIRWRADGTNPTSSVGHTLNPGDYLPYNGSDLTKFKAIQTSAGAVLNVSFYG